MGVKGGIEGGIIGGVIGVVIGICIAIYRLAVLDQDLRRKHKLLKGDSSNYATLAFGWVLQGVFSGGAAGLVVGVIVPQMQQL
mmetsp:Transcript_36724/g.115021  ORF Transcript_36724/g.115021 Transcript_36724/m.115021 type:complete len:83 (+) Transcript_36724:76-324(+)